MARVPGGFGINDVMGVRRPDRSVSVGQAWSDALLARARQEAQYRPVQEPAPSWVSNVTNSTVGRIMGQPDLASQEAAFSELAAQAVTGTPATMMQQQRLAGGIDEVLDWVRPLALADLGFRGAAGRGMILFPNLAPGVAPAARAARGAGGGIAGALRQLLRRGSDEGVDAVSAGFQQNALSGSIRAPQPHADPKMWDLASGNHVGMGRLSGYTEADIQRWYLHTEAGLPHEFSGETGERLAEVARGNQRALSGLSGETVAAAEKRYDVDRMAWERIVSESTEAAGRVGRPYYKNIDELETAAKPAWEGGPTLFHGGPEDMSGFQALGEGRMLGSRSAMGNATYTTPDIQFASQYANQSVEAQGAIFRGTHSPPIPSTVQSVRFTGDGAPNLIDYGKAGIDTKAQQAVRDTLDHLDKLLAAHPGTLPPHPNEYRRELLAKLEHPRTTFADIHGFSEHARTGSQGSTLRAIVEAIIRRNTETGPFRLEQLNEMMSIVMSRLSDNLSNAGYHGFVAPAGGGFHMAHTARHGQSADKFGGSIAWFNPSKDLEIVGTAQHNVMGVTHPSGRLGLVPSGYRADNYFGSPAELARRHGQR